jgi:amidase
MAANQRPLWKWTAVELALGIRTRQISSREAVTACLERAHAVNPALNALVQLLDESALAAADEADRAVARGEFLGGLHGVPVTTKVNVDQVGLATTNGLVSLKDNIAKFDSPVVANLKKAGAVIFGRSNTPAFSMRWFTENALHGRTLNPWSLGHTPGGSSGGASSAVAAGIGPIAHGNDLAGSVRYPAYCTGIYGLRPSFGRVPSFLPSATQERPLSPQLMSVQGPLARTVADIRLALEAMSQADPRDPWWVPAPLHWPAAKRPTKVALSFDCGEAKPQPQVVAALRQAATWLSQAGYFVEEVKTPSVAEAMEVWDLISRNENLLLVKPLIASMGDEGIQRSFAAQFDGAPLLDMEAHLRAIARRSTLIREWALFMQDWPLVLGPVSAELAFAQGADTVSKESSRRVLAAQAPCFSVPVLGLPAISAPIGVVNGLPSGVQILGARFREDMVLDAAEVLEARAPSATPIDPRAY